MEKRSLLLLGVITLGWVQPVCTVVAAKMETTPQSYSAVMDKTRHYPGSVRNLLQMKVHHKKG